VHTQFCLQPKFDDSVFELHNVMHHFIKMSKLNKGCCQTVWTTRKYKW